MPQVRIFGPGIFIACHHERSRRTCFSVFPHPQKAPCPILAILFCRKGGKPQISIPLHILPVNCVHKRPRHNSRRIAHAAIVPTMPPSSVNWVPVSLISTGKGRNILFCSVMVERNLDQARLGIRYLYGPLRIHYDSDSYPRRDRKEAEDEQGAPAALD